MNQTPQQESQVNETLTTIYDVSPMEGITTKEKVIYINEARKSKYFTVLTDLPLTPRNPISFSDADAMVVHFPHNDALIVTTIIGNCRVTKVLVDRGSFVNILYGGALDRMEDTPEITRAMISPQTQSHLYGFDGSETHSPGTVALPVHFDQYNVITEFYLVAWSLLITRSSWDRDST